MLWLARERKSFVDPKLTAGSPQLNGLALLPAQEEAAQRALLEKMGWRAGDGLGAASSGATRAVAETMQAQTDRRGLGSKPRGAR